MGQPSLKTCIINHDSFVSGHTPNKNRMEIEEKCSKVLSPYEKNILSTSLFVWFGVFVCIGLFSTLFFEQHSAHFTMWLSCPGSLNLRTVLSMRSCLALLNLSGPCKWMLKTQPSSPASKLSDMDKDLHLHNHVGEQLYNCLEVWIWCLSDTTSQKHNCLLVPGNNEPTVSYKKLLIMNAVLNQNSSVSHLIIYMLIIVSFT